MILAQTGAYIQSELTPVILGMIIAGCSIRIVKKGIEAQSKGQSWEELMNSIKGPLWASIISIIIVALVAIIKKYYT